MDVVSLHLADVSFPEGHPQAGERGPVLAFALIHPRGILLFDTGLGTDEPEIGEWYRPVLRPLAEALGANGISLSDVVAVANSHLHFDHCGQNRLFNGRPTYVQAAEYRAAHEPGYTVARWVDFPGATYELLEGEAEVLPGVRLVPSPGHTPGHQSLVVEAEAGPELVAGQAVYTADEWEGATDITRSGEQSAWDLTAYAATVERLRALDPRRVYFAHDESVWKRT